MRPQEEGPASRLHSAGGQPNTPEAPPQGEAPSSRLQRGLCWLQASGATVGAQSVCQGPVSESWDVGVDPSRWAEDRGLATRDAVAYKPAG